jgi:hypothetical protein
VTEYVPITDGSVKPVPEPGKKGYGSKGFSQRHLRQVCLNRSDVVDIGRPLEKWCIGDIEMKYVINTDPKHIRFVLYSI